MPKNQFGGKNAKKMANKRVGETTSLVVPDPDASTVAAIVTKRCGDGRFIVEYMGDEGRLETAIARVPGSMKKITRNVREGSFLLYQPWDFNEREKKGSILCLYSDVEVSILLRQGFLAGLVVDEEQEVEQKTDTVADQEVDIDGI